MTTSDDASNALGEALVQGALAAFQEHGLAALECLVQQQPGIGDAVGETLGQLQRLVDYLLRVQSLAVVDLGEDLVFHFQGRFDLLLGVGVRFSEDEGEAAPAQISLFDSAPAAAADGKPD